MPARVTQETAEALVQPTTQRARVTQAGAEALVQPTTQRARVTQVLAEVLLEGPFTPVVPPTATGRSFVVGAG